MRRDNIFRTASCAIALALAGAIAVCAQQGPPPAPQLTTVEPDRAVPGDLITLTGANFTAGDGHVTVNFGATSISTAPDSDTQVSVVVPSGAKSGAVTVTTTASYNGQNLVQTSNAQDLLVVWKTFDLTPVLGPPSAYGNIYGAMPGDKDNLYLWTIQSAWGHSTGKIVEVDGDGSSSILFAWPYGCSAYSNFARNPISGEWVALHSNGCGQQTDEIVNMTSGEVLYSYPYPTQGGGWIVCDLAFDGSGALYVMGIYWPSGGGDPHYCIWRFAPGDSIALDAGNLQSLIPGGTVVPNGDSWPYIRVSADGTVYAYVIMSAPGYHDSQVWRILPETTGYQVYAEPPHGADNWGTFYMTTDCMGRAYGVNPCQWDDTCMAPPTIYSCPDNTPLATASDLSDPIGAALTTDGYGDLYVGGRDNGTKVLRRILPSELPAGYYDNFTCCATQTPLRAMVQRIGGKTVSPPCAVGTLEVKLTPDPSKPNVSTTITPDENGKATATVLFGQTPELQAEWVPAPGQQGKAETVTWTVKDEMAPNAGPGLFPDRPELFFGWAGKQQVSKTARFQTVHTGHFVVTLTTVSSHEGAQRNMTLTVDIKEPKGLSDGPGPKDPYDPDILYYADVYGIPPQYVKSQVYKESDRRYKADAFRYEPESFDRQKISSWKQAQWDAHDYYMYRFPRTLPTSILTSADIAPRNLYQKISLYTIGANWPYTCAKFSTSDMDVTLWDYFSADNGWQEWMAPFQLYFPPHKTPCDPRQNWITSLGWDAGQYYWKGGSGAPQTGHAPPAYFWFLRHPDYVAQTAICSSYGLMQVMYTTAVEKMQWRQGQTGAARHPSDLMNPDTSLNLGVGYDAWLMDQYMEPYADNLAAFESYLRKGFVRYNGKPSNPKAQAYGRDVVQNASLFKPY